MKKNFKDLNSVNPKSRVWMIEVPNPLVDEIQPSDDIVCAAWQIERGQPSEDNPEGLRHMHLFVEFINQRYKNSVKKYFSYLGVPHLDLPENKIMAYRYCTKKPGEAPWQDKIFTVEIPPKFIGDKPLIPERNETQEQKKETKSDKIAKKIMSGEWTIKDVVQNEPGWYMLNHSKVTSFILRHKSEECKNKIWKPFVVWLHGLTGTGKTSAAEWFERICFKVEPDIITVTGVDNAFINGYFGADSVIIDETRGEIPYKELLKLLDWNYGGRVVNMKGISDGKWFPKRIYITSCYPPDQIYNKQMTREDKIDQLIRRIDYIENANPIHWNEQKPLIKWLFKRYEMFVEDSLSNKHELPPVLKATEKFLKQRYPDWNQRYPKPLTNVDLLIDQNLAQDLAHGSSDGAKTFLIYDQRTQENATKSQENEKIAPNCRNLEFLAHGSALDNSSTPTASPPGASNAIENNIDLDKPDDYQNSYERLLKLIPRCTMTDDEKFREYKIKHFNKEQALEEESIKKRHKASLINIERMFRDEEDE